MGIVRHFQALDEAQLKDQSSSQDFPPPVVKEAIRQMLRRDGFRPAGRNKPANGESYRLKESQKHLRRKKQEATEAAQP
jgi:hypothetical protein